MMGVLVAKDFCDGNPALINNNFHNIYDIKLFQNGNNIEVVKLPIKLFVVSKQPTEKQLPDTIELYQLFLKVNNYFSVFSDTNSLKTLVFLQKNEVCYLREIVKIFNLPPKTTLSLLKNLEEKNIIQKDNFSEEAKKIRGFADHYYKTISQYHIHKMVIYRLTPEASAFFEPLNSILPFWLDQGTCKAIENYKRRMLKSNASVIEKKEPEKIVDLKEKNEKFELDLLDYIDSHSQEQVLDYLNNFLRENKCSPFCGKAKIYFNGIKRRGIDAYKAQIELRKKEALR